MLVFITEDEFLSSDNTRSLRTTVENDPTRSLESFHAVLEFYRNWKICQITNVTDKSFDVLIDWIHKDTFPEGRLMITRRHIELRNAK